MTFSQKALRVLLAVFIINTILVAFHKGEFWPMSVYPMFSKAGKPWTRALVHDYTGLPDSTLWLVRTYDNLPGKNVSVRAMGVDQIDYSNFVSKTKNWNPERVTALRFMLGEDQFKEKDLMIMKVNGQLIGKDSVGVEIVPYLLFKSDTTLFNPYLPQSDYFME
jgi:hypothetical protein